MLTLPDIIIHPGYPKCATSSLQSAFLSNNYAFSRELNIKYIGKNFTPFNGYPPITEIVYSLDKCLKDLEKQQFSQGCYFLSSEALFSRPLFLKK